jgi:hypothetical protein
MHPQVGLAFALRFGYEYNRKINNDEGRNEIPSRRSLSMKAFVHLRIRIEMIDSFNKSISLNQDYSRLQIYRIRSTILLRYLGLALFGLIGMFVFIIIGLLRWQFVIVNFGPAILWRWIHPILWAASILGLVGIIGLFLLLHNARQEIQLSPMGITWRKGSKLDVIPWDEIKNIFVTSVHYGILDYTWANRTEVVLQLENKRQLKINQAFRDILTLVETLKHYVYPKMFEKFRTAFNQGEPMQFGPIILTSQGILNGRKALRWQDIGKIELQRGVLQLKPLEEMRGPQFSVPAHKIPNVDLCIQILHHFGSQT